MLVNADRFMRKMASRLTAPLLMLLLGWVYWEFYHDPRPSEAIEFFFPIGTVADEDNAIFSIAGLAAPRGTANIRQWGYRRINDNRERIRDGLNPEPLLSRRNQAEDYPKLSGSEPGKRFCWSIDASAAPTRDDCYLERELEVAVARNRTLLERYESIFAYSAIDNRHYYGVDLAETYAYTDLYAAQFWLRRTRLDAADYARIFRFFRFWQNLYLNAALGTSGRAMLMINYARASRLLSTLAQVDPDILLEYYAVHGDFDPPADRQILLDDLLRQEFRLLDRLYCLRGHFGVADDCAPVAFRFPGKEGETTRKLFASRPTPEICAAQVDRASLRFERRDRWRFMLRDPGNIFGNFLLTTVADRARLCQALRQYLQEAEVNLLRNTYLEFRRQNLDAPDLARRFAVDPVIFDNGFSGNQIRWDAPGRRLVMLNRRFPREYFIPYR